MRSSLYAFSLGSVVSLFHNPAGFRMIIIGFSLSLTIPASASLLLMRCIRSSFISASYWSGLKILFAVSFTLFPNALAVFTIGTTIFFITFFLLSSLPSSLIPSNPFFCFFGSSSFPYKASPIPFWIFSRTGLRTAAAAATGLTFGSVGVGAAAPPELLLIALKTSS